ncbi:MAG: type II toxin-antitoxin system HigB family toxin [Cyanobacteria bacterium TGS_CYA1]|nr:type II toxin-antitoxin system HigB family toxin [Cyanobacteria bacterium TGS_CYA1]
MEVFNQNLLYEFGKLHPSARKPLAVWLATVESRDWSNLIERKQDFPSCDYIPKSRYCFNIKSNEFRLLVSISFQLQQITVSGVFTHAEYSKLAHFRKSKRS